MGEDHGAGEREGQGVGWEIGIGDCVGFGRRGCHFVGDLCG